MMSSPTIRRAVPADAPMLAALGLSTFLATFMDDFAMDYPPDDLAAFIAAAYSEELFARKIADPETGVWVAQDAGGAAIGYATAGPNALPHPDARPGDGELQRLYLTRAAQGSGAGRALMETVLEWLDPERARVVWIGVWSGNARALAFYARYGFEKAGEYQFRVGRTLDDEFILRRGPRLPDLHANASSAVMPTRASAPAAQS